ncbi:hypothetical protein [Lentzea sp. E54]|uniref:hypothetical protein n=1 Tax=Lentzea xerophila TaxID=3435883 RepID=UPI003DA53EE3
MAGVPFTKDSLNNDVGSVVRQVYAAFDNVRKLQATLAGKPDEDLVALGFSSAEVADIKSAFIDLDNLRQVFEGIRAQAGASDFRSFAKRLIGSGLY